ncbi:helix-turn-helix transcriptional regulator, partial [Kistimonas scapharcae]|uniref:helix-turn-helix transcriptional regulator n=1 Tax=Kistimonas scapharcae TaxID=1036133 RepID=UPI0031EB004D
FRDWQILSNTPHAGCHVVCTGVFEYLHASASQSTQTINPELLKETYALTAREAEIATQVLMGKGDKAISYELDISFTTVRTHMKNIFSKLSVQNRTALAHKLMS